MKIISLCDNVSCNENIRYEHGLSLYIETNGHKILFDAGQTDVFFENAKALGIDLNEVDIFILSHGHYDHGGGIKKFLKINKKAKIYLSKYAFCEYYNKNNRYIGLDFDVLECGRLVFTDDYRVLFNGASLYSCNDKELKYKIDGSGLLKIKDGEIFPDDFKHEQYLKISENGKTYLISGCSHRGILNIINWFSVDYLIGGFHLKEKNPEDDKSFFLSLARELIKNNTIYYTCHCTGEPQFTALKTEMGKRLNYLSSGQMIEI